MQPAVIVAAIVLIIGVIFGFNSCAVVEPGMRGVEVTLGSVGEHALAEGVNFRMPILTAIHQVSVRQMTVPGTTACFSADLQTVTISYSVLYRVPEGSVVTLFRDYQGDPFESLLKPRLEERLKAVTATYTAENLAKSREKMRIEALAATRLALDGLIDVVDLAIANIDLSDQLESAIEAKMVKEQESLAKKYELDKAEKQAEIDIITAKGEAQAMAERARPITENPLVLAIDILKKWDGVLPSTLVVGSEASPALLLPPLKSSLKAER